MSQPCASDILVSSLPEGGFEVDNSNGDVSRANKFPPSQWESNQNDGQFRDAMLDFLSSLSDETLQLLLQKGDKWCDELLHHSVTAAWKPAATTNMDCLPSDVTMTLSAGVNEAGICEDYEDIDNHISVDAAERKSQNLSDQVAADLIMADRPDNTSSYNNDQCIQHDGNNTMHGGNKQSSLMTAKVTPTGSMDAVNCKELNQENRTSKDNLSQPLPNSLSLLSYLQPADNNLDFPKPYIKVEPELATDSDCSAMVPINAKIKTEDLSKFAEAISNTDELASLLSGNQLQAQNNVREMLIERDLSLKSKHNASRFLGNVFTDQLDNNADRKVTFSDLNDDHHELLSSSLPLSSFPSIPADEISYRSNSPSSGGQPFLLNSLNHTLNLASFADKGQAANTSAIDIIARNCGLQMDKPSFDADTTKRHWPQQQQQDQQTASTTATAMMPADLIAPSTTTSLIKALQRKQQQLPRHSGAQSTVKQYTCPQYECRKMFTRPSHLKRHLKVHAGLKPFPCPHCHKWFSRSDNLTKHIRIHTGEKLFSCNFCQKRFSDSSNLTKHVRTHTGEKPYRCVYCSQTFTESRTLSRHMRTHSLMMMMMMEMDMVGGAGGRVRREAQEAGYDIVVGSN
uniref:C2H2-type domain-containing protein n=5 Tax=Octopus bimaculoides TaxID=37653 RepID=A0A0L8FYE1_OCTBM